MKKRNEFTRNGDKCLQRITSVFIALMLSIFLLMFSENGYGQIVEFKYILFLVICGGYCIAIIVARIILTMLKQRPAEKIGKLIIQLPTAYKFLILYMLFVTLSAILSKYNGTFSGSFRKDGLLTVYIYIISCLLISKHIRPQKWMLFLLGASTCFYCLLSLAQLTGANPFTLYPQGYNYYGAGVYYSGEFLGTTGNAGLSAAFLSVAVGVLVMTLIKFDFQRKWFLAIPLFLAVTLVFKSDIDAGIVALAGGLLFILPVAITNQKSLSNMFFVAAIIITSFSLSRAIIFSDHSISFAPKRLVLLIAAVITLILAIFIRYGSLSELVRRLSFFRRQRKQPIRYTRDTGKESGVFSKISARWYSVGAAICVLLLIMLGILYLWFYKGGSSGMIYEASELLHGRWKNDFGSSRIYIWRNVLSNVKNNLLFGTGPDTLGYWGIEPFTKFDASSGVSYIANFDSAHNEFMQILACSGIISLICYISAIAVLIVKWLRTPDNTISAVAGAGMVFYCIHAFFSITMFITTSFFWVTFGVLIYAQYAQKNAVQSNTDSSSKILKQSGRIERRYL